MVRALHEADIEVVVDVVYNHTAEGDQAGPVQSFKGIDNSTYYLMSRSTPGRYENLSGAGNTFNCANRAVRLMILDSLRHWAREMGVDGFRFDLASVFTRNLDGSVNYSDPLLAADVMADPGLAGLRLIAEPWDAAGVYQLGRSFPAQTWFQWNGRFRDDVRRVVRGEPSLVPSLMPGYMAATTCSRTLPSTPITVPSVNYVTCHDGSRSTTWWPSTRSGTGPTGMRTPTGQPRTTAGTAAGRATTGCPMPWCPCAAADQEPLLIAVPVERHPDDAGRRRVPAPNSATAIPYNQDNETTWLDWSRLERHRTCIASSSRPSPFERPIAHLAAADSGATTSSGTASVPCRTCPRRRAVWPSTCAGHRRATATCTS